MSTIPLVPESTEISINDPRLTEPQLPTWGGLARDMESGRWGIRTDLDKPLEPDAEAIARELLALDNPEDATNKFRSRANSQVACMHLGRLATCEHGDEARFYLVHCGQKTLCRQCGTGKSLTRQLQNERPELYALVDASPHQLLTFSLNLGSPCQGPHSMMPELELLARVRIAKYLYRRLKLALDRRSEDKYGAKFFPVLDPASHAIQFKVLFLNVECTLHRIRAMWEAICLRHWKRVQRLICEARGVWTKGSGKWVEAVTELNNYMLGLPTMAQSSVDKQSYDIDSANKSIPRLLNGIEPLLMLPPKDRVRYATQLEDCVLSITTGLLRGQALDEAAEGLWTEIADDNDHGECSHHHTPLKMQVHEAPITAAEASYRFERVWFGPIGANRVKAVHTSYRIPTTAAAVDAAPPPW